MDSKKCIETYSQKLKEKLINNKNLIIEAFVKYYGEEYRSFITDRYNEIVFGWYIPNDFNKIYESLLTHIEKLQIFAAKEILFFLGFDVSDCTYDHKLEISTNKNKLPVCYIKNIVGKDNTQYDDILYELFGEARSVNINYLETNLFDFTHNYSTAEKEKLLKRIYKRDITSEDIRMFGYAQKMALNYYYKLNSLINVFKNFSIFNDYAKKQNNNEIFDCTEDFHFYKDSMNETISRMNLQNSATSNRWVQLLIDNYDNIYDINVYHYIVFILGLTDDANLIHEINHRIVCFILAISNNNTYSKNGISNSGQYMALEEFLNEKVSLEIAETFEKLGGNIFGINNIFSCTYRKYFCLIDKFYELLKEPLKKIRMTDNLNLLYKYVDKDIFKQYLIFIQDVYNKRKVNFFAISEEEIKYANELVDKMAKKEEKEMSKSETIELLKSMNYKFKTLKCDKQEDETKKLYI